MRMPKPDRRQVPQRPVTRSRATKEHKERVLETPVTTDNSSGSEDESYGYYFPDRPRQWTQLIPDLQHKLEVKEDEGKCPHRQ